MKSRVFTLKRIFVFIAVSACVLLLAGYGGFQYLTSKQEKADIEVKKKATAVGVKEENSLNKHSKLKE